MAGVRWHGRVILPALMLSAVLGRSVVRCRLSRWTLMSVLFGCASQQPAPSGPSAGQPTSAAATSAPSPAAEELAPGGSGDQCSEMVLAADGLVDDAEGGGDRIPTVAGRSGTWAVSKDSKGTEVRVPAGRFVMSAGGANGTSNAARAKGKAGSSDGAWGANLGLLLNDSRAYDASAYSGVSFWAKRGPGSLSVVRFHIGDARTVSDGGICSECWNDFGKDIELTSEWKRYVVSFSELKQTPGWGEPRPDALDPKRLWHLSWHVPASGAEFDIWIDEVRFLECKR